MASSVCCTSPPVTFEYTPLGETIKVDVAGTPTVVYVTGSGRGGVVLVTDIFGLAFNQVLQVADRLAATGLCVAVPDIFNGNPWPMEKMPMKPEDNFMGWVGQYPWESVRKQVDACVELLKGKGAEKFGCIGFCWGLAMAIQAGATSTFSAVGGPHPTFFGKEKEFAAELKCPIILLPAKGDPMEAVKEVTDTKPFGPSCVYQRFDDQTHGFCAARGDWRKPDEAAAAAQAIDLMASFLKANLL